MTTAATERPRLAPLASPSASRRRIQRLREGAITMLLRLTALAAVGGLVLIMIFVFREALPVLFDPAIRKEADPRIFLEKSPPRATRFDHENHRMRDSWIL